MPKTAVARRAAKKPPARKSAVGRVSVRQVAPTVARLMGLRNPAKCTARPVREVLLTSGPVKKCLVFAVDSIPEYMMKRRPELFRRTVSTLPQSLPAHSVFPSVTPVNFASMFTGAMPRVHGIRKYEKPVLTCETLFDTALEAGRRVAIIDVALQSIDTIFRGRAIDYFSEKDDAGVVARALKLLEEGRHDLILAHNEAYDDADHASTPTSPIAIGALKAHDRDTEILFRATQRHWRGHDRLFLWVTDHGCHVDPVTGKGTHGKNIPEDMEISLRWRYERGTGGAATPA